MSSITDIEDLVLIKQEFVKELSPSFDSNSFIKHINKKFKLNCKKSDLINIYNDMNLNDPILKNKLIKKIQKSQSGIISITVLTSGIPEYTDKNGIRVKKNFSCLHKCSFCPDEKPSPDNNWTQQPKSYLFTEPAVLRANQNNFDPILQMNARITSLIHMGHQVDKIELLVLGGTWSEYPKEYQDEFITSLYYACNIFYDTDFKRPMLSLDDEISLNENAKIHIIGLTLEMRPDSINIDEIKRLRRFNCTRVQLGIQHTNNHILKLNNRGEIIENTKKTIELLKNNCYKIDAHIMLNLYGSTPEIDRHMLSQFLYDEYLQIDQVKIYPCAIVPFTKIKELYDNGIYIPYDDSYLIPIIKEFKMNIKPYMRINRIIRDISGHYIKGGYRQEFTNLRQILKNDMILNNWSCRCIRCREIKSFHPNHRIHLDICHYYASGGIEYFLSFVTNDDKLIGFLRLRIPPFSLSTSILPILHKTALIRELHIYSSLSTVGNNNSISYQHKGFGKELIHQAELIAIHHGFYKVAIIAGTGVRNYYRRLGYELIDTYMCKYLYPLPPIHIIFHLFIYFLFIIYNLFNYLNYINNSVI
jgi:ELP3 family radical SAM enzyme/protein acetyltransferase